MTWTTKTLNELHDLLSDPRQCPDGFLLIETAGDMAAVMSMPPGPDSMHRGSCWVETRSRYLGEGRTLYAVISYDTADVLHVTAYGSEAEMDEEYMDRREDVLGHARGRRIGDESALDLLHRTVVNQHGAAFRVAGFSVEAAGRLVIDLIGVNEEDEAIPGTETGVPGLEGWHVV